MADSYTEGEIAGIVIGCLIGIPLVIFLILFALRMWMRGPTKGSDNTKKLDGKLVIITGKLNSFFYEYNSNVINPIPPGLCHMITVYVLIQTIFCRNRVKTK